ncbi:MAG: hypothetical protein LBU73_06510 [Helicobacteraceae bacterium]|jgi:chromosome segregation ATPase|nr:hypothetical protein [Helicobacteraceae bacterium]
MNSWNDRLKIAIVNEEVETIARLHGEIPQEFSSIGEARESSALIGEALALLRRKRDQLQAEIEQTKKTIAYQQTQVEHQRAQRRSAYGDFADDVVAPNFSAKE